MKNKKDPAFTRKLISLVMPIAFQQFMLALVSASDALMLGVISQDSLSAVSLAGQITFIHNLLLEAMTIGLSLIAAQYWGKGDIPAVERIFAFVMKVTTGIMFSGFSCDGTDRTVLAAIQNKQFINTFARTKCLKYRISSFYHFSHFKLPPSQVLRGPAPVSLKNPLSDTDIP